MVWSWGRLPSSREVRVRRAPFQKSFPHQSAIIRSYVLSWNGIALSEGLNFLPRQLYFFFLKKKLTDISFTFYFRRMKHQT